ncbi:MAG: biotin--[acetyl-CoA-carboxylase] ligase, partial [Candidatus Omnitrophica bacterium]|nr:biotin--[acetyl-CoA-carboxylase] ligase [Candidatus Omnitrophota bacterium]
GEVDSTNDMAFKLAQEGAPEVTAVYSDTQKKGRGRRGREWCSPPGGIYVSFVVRPARALQELKFLPVIVSYALIKVLRQNGIKDAYIKWPNDVMIENKKVAGVLVEARVSARVEFAVIGIGLNVNSERKDLPSQATSLCLQTQKPAEIKEIFEKTVEEFLAVYSEFKEKGCRNLLTLSKKITVMPADSEFLPGVMEGKEAGNNNSGDNDLILVR